VCVCVHINTYISICWLLLSKEALKEQRGAAASRQARDERQDTLLVLKSTSKASNLTPLEQVRLLQGKLETRDKTRAELEKEFARKQEMLEAALRRRYEELKASIQWQLKAAYTSSVRSSRGSRRCSKRRCGAQVCTTAVRYTLLLYSIHVIEWGAPCGAQVCTTAVLYALLLYSTL